MNVYLVTTNEPFHLWRIVDSILSHDRRRFVKGIILLSPASRKGGWKALIKQFWNLYDIRTFLVTAIIFVWAKASRIFKWVPRPINIRFIDDIANMHGVEVIPIADINSSEALDKLGRRKPDLLVSISASQIFRNDILNLPTIGAINVHAAPLPDYRGLMPSFWQLYNNEKEGAVTVHWMEEGIDDGDILLQRKFAIDPDETQESLIVKGKLLGSEIVLEALEIIENHGRDAPSRPNDKERGRYFSFPNKDEAHRFRRMGKRFR